MNKNKYYLLIIFNILFGLLITINAIPSLVTFSIPLSTGSLLHHYLPLILTLLILGLNIYSFYTLVKSQEREKIFKSNLIITLYSIFWFLLIFLGYFFANNVIFPAISFVVVGIIFHKLKRFYPNIARVLSIVSLLIVILVIIFSFEESYCWGKGDEADPSGSKMVAITEQDRKLFPNLAEGINEVGLAVLTHFKCHNNFNLIKAIQEKYLFIK